MTNTIRCISPIDLSLYAEKPVLKESEINRLVNNSRSALKDWSSLSIAKRTALVKNSVKFLEEENEQAVLELAWQMGRPIRYNGEVSIIRERVDFMAGIAEKSLAPIILEQNSSFNRKIKRVPQGIVFVIAPWNYPYITAINTIAPALIAGNTVILKHASQTILVGDRLVDAFHKAGVPKDVIQNFYLSHESCNKIISSGLVDVVNFTGSVAGGKIMEQAAAGTFTAVYTELGGKDPAYVMSDAKMDSAVASLMDGAFYNSGQCCCGIERIYVNESIFDEFVSKSLEIAKKLQLGNPLKQETTIGPMANIKFANEVRMQINEAIKDGAKVLIEESFYPNDKDAYIMPQILINVNHNMRIMRQETFGPVVCVMPVKNDKQAISLMNDSDYGLTASLWTKNTKNAENIADKLEFGTVFLNRCDYCDPGLCWTGIKNTGRGASLSEIGFHNLTRPKSYHLKF